MIDSERLAAFMLMTAVTSIVPGVSMLFVVGRAISDGWRGGIAGLAGMQMGYICWWLLAAFGLGTLAIEFPTGFRTLTVLGALYLGWLGIGSIRQAGVHGASDSARPGGGSGSAFRDGMLVALSNPKSLIYVVALLPPFIDPRLAVGPQLIILAAAALTIDILVGSVYIAAGSRLASAMARPTTRAWFDRGVGGLFIMIALGILIDLALR